MKIHELWQALQQLEDSQPLVRAQQSSAPRSWKTYQEHEVVFMCLGFGVFALGVLSLFLKCVPEKQRDVEKAEVGDASGLSRSSTFLSRSGSFRRAIIKVDHDGWLHHTVSTEELTEELGISGMCVLEPRETFGLNGVAVYKALPLIALQSLLLQMIVLAWLALQIHPRDAKVAGVDKQLPQTIVFFSVYVHFISCCGDMAFSIFLARWIWQQTHDPLSWVMFFVFFSDAFFVPLSTLFIGSLYLINSANIAETILNCCAVAFISSIDNWILEAQDKMNAMAGRKTFHREVTIEVHAGALQWVNWMLTLIPIVPAGFAIGMMQVGNYFKL